MVRRRVDQGQGVVDGCADWEQFGWGKRTKVSDSLHAPMWTLANI